MVYACVTLFSFEHLKFVFAKTENSLPLCIGVCTHCVLYRSIALSLDMKASTVETTCMDRA